jgi:hypothetical protein
LKIARSLHVDKTLFSPDATFAAVTHLVFKVPGRPDVTDTDPDAATTTDTDDDDSADTDADADDGIELAYGLDIIKSSDGSLIRRLSGAFPDFKFSADRRHFAAGGFDGNVTLVDLETNKVSRIRVSQSQEVSFVTFDDRSRLSAAVTVEGVHVIDLAKGREVAEIPNEGLAVLDTVAFSADGTRIAIAENNRYGTSAVKVWLLDPDRLSDEAVNRLNDLKKLRPVEAAASGSP